MGMWGDKSVLDMTAEEFQEWKASIERQREYERRFDEATGRAVATAKMHILFGLT